MAQRIHILLADDEAGFRFAASIALRGAGYRVSVAIDGHDAFCRIVSARLSGDPVQILVTDQQMPGMNGAELVSVLRAQGFNIPVIVVTAFRDLSAGFSVDPECVSEFIEKPIAPNELVACLARVMERSVEQLA